MAKKAKTTLLLAKITVNICRFVLAATFIFSGFIKANDPMGMAYKMGDYLSAFGITNFPESFTIAASIVLAFVEFMMGIFLLFGISRKPMSRLVTTFMLLMTLLTVYIFIFDPVADCGCFGDAIILTNGETLLKNIVLLAASLTVLRWYRHQIRLVRENMDSVMTMFATLYILSYSIYCIVELPVFDFRPYYIGADIRNGRETTEDMRPQYEVKLVYEREGKTMEIDIDDEEPDSSWEYVETKRILLKDGSSHSMADFYIMDANEEDITEEVLAEEGYSFLLIAPFLQNADEGCIDLINEAYDYAQNNGYGFYCITASDTAAQEYWTDHTGAEYPYYRGDERTLKTVVRANPGLVLIKDGKVVRKWGNYNMPNEYELNGSLEDIPAGQTETVEARRKIINILLWFFIPLALFIIFDRIAMGWSFYRMMKRKSKELKLESIEEKLYINEIEKNINNKFNIKTKEK
ncbi:MAG: DoxX family protein [Bacteroidaceae bacterium]|nr:DoxX family protein [Bacteroidaceae bacterium]